MRAPRAESLNLAEGWEEEEGRGVQREKERKRENARERERREWTDARIESGGEDSVVVARTHYIPLHSLTRSLHY